MKPCSTLSVQKSDSRAVITVVTAVLDQATEHMNANSAVSQAKRKKTTQWSQTFVVVVLGFFLLENRCPEAELTAMRAPMLECFLQAENRTKNLGLKTK